MIDAKEVKLNNMEKFKLGILPYIIILFFLVLAVIKIRDTRLVNTSIQTVNTGDLSLIESEEWNRLDATTLKVKNENSIVIYNPDDENSKGIYTNVKYVLEKIGVNVVGVKLNEQEKYSDLSDYETMVICIDNLQDLKYSDTTLKNWVKKGKGIFFTVPLHNNEILAKYSDSLDIEEKIETLNYDNMTFTDDFLIGAKGVKFGEIAINGYGLKVKLKDNATAHAITSEGNPVIWNALYGDGYVSVCNANFLSDKISRGIITASYAELHKTYAYPVINSAMYCIDDFPSPIPIGYNNLIYEQYGCNMEDFNFNIWWPKMKRLTEKYGIKYTGLLIQTYENKVEPPYDNTTYIETSKYYANALLNSGGEMGLHGYNHQSLALNGFDYRDEQVSYIPWKSMDDMWEALRSAIKYGKTLAPNAKITTYVAPSNIISSYVREEMEKNIDEIKVYAGVYIGSESQMVQEFEAKENGIVYVPRTDSGMDVSLDTNSDFLMYNELTFHYVHSNFFHPDDIIDINRGANQGFETLYGKYEDLVKSINSTKIRNTTVAEGGAAVQRYQLTSCKEKYTDGKLVLDVEGIYDKVNYMIHLNDANNIKNIEGAEYEKINDKYYLLKINQEHVVVEIE